MAHITHSNPTFTGSIGLCRFVKGEGDTDIPTLVAYFERHPHLYTVEDPAGEGHEPGPYDNESLRNLQFEAAARELETEGDEDAAQLVALLEANDLETNDTGGDVTVEDAELAELEAQINALDSDGGTEGE